MKHDRQMVRLMEQIAVPSRNKNFDFYETVEGQELQKTVKRVRSLLRDVATFGDDFTLDVQPSFKPDEVICNLVFERLHYSHQIVLTKKEFVLLEKCGLTNRFTKDM